MAGREQSARRELSKVSFQYLGEGGPPVAARQGGTGGEDRHQQRIDDLARTRKLAAECYQRIRQLEAELEESAGKAPEPDGRLSKEVLDDLGDNLVRIQPELYLALAEVGRLQQGQRRMEVELLVAMGRVASLEQALSAAEERNNSLEMDLQVAGGHVATLKAEWKRKAEQYRNVVEAVHERVGGAQAESGRAAAWLAEANRLEEELADVLASREGVQSELNMARSVINELNGDIVQLQDLLDGRNQTVAQLYADMAEVRLELAAVRPAAEEAQVRAGRIVELEAQVAAGQAELERCKQQLFDLLAWVERSRKRRLG